MEQTYYKVIHNHKSYDHPNLRSAIQCIYLLLIEQHILPSELTVKQYYLNILSNEFNVKHNDSLFLYNNETSIKVQILYPEFYYFSNIFTKRNPIINTITKKTETAIGTIKSQTPIEPKKNPKVEIPKNEMKLVKKKVTQPLVSKEDLTSFNLKIPEVDKKLSQYISDRESFRKIRNDIELGKMNINDIAPWFSMKYTIFSILDSRGSINFNNKNDYPLIEKEHELFEIMLEATEDKEDDIKIELDQNIYVPHNYNYLSDDEKNDIASKYNLSRMEFEEKYVKKDETINTF